MNDISSLRVNGIFPYSETLLGLFLSGTSRCDINIQKQGQYQQSLLSSYINKFEMY